ncbi:hypothetical protein FOA52_004366 [Chlamydomonas sp. UWO 241]|nr:hypothetical protein FOA52_004366 [Chlamydomonas sp. UWO 241]
MALSGVQTQAERGAERLLRLQVVLSGLARASTAASSSASSTSGGVNDALEAQVSSQALRCQSLLEALGGELQAVATAAADLQTGSSESGRLPDSPLSAADSAAAAHAVRELTARLSSWEARCSQLMGAVGQLQAASSRRALSTPAAQVSAATGR